MNESGVHFCHESQPQNTSFEDRQTRGFPISMHRSFIPQDKGGDGERTTVDRFSSRRFTSHSILENEEDTLALKLTSSTNASEDDNPLSNEETASYLSIKAAAVASQWLGLILQDIKGRVAALRRSRKRVRDVITTDLPALLSKEFPSDQEIDPCITKNSAGEFPCCSIADMHPARWNPLFEQMDKGLYEEEDQLESWSNQVQEMQLHCDQGLQIVQWNTASGIQQLGTSENDPRSHILDNSDRALACSLFIEHATFFCRQMYPVSELVHYSPSSPQSLSNLYQEWQNTTVTIPVVEIISLEIYYFVSCGSPGSLIHSWLNLNQFITFEF